MALTSIMNGRERLTAILAGERPDRLPIPGVGAWDETLDRWRHEGLPEGVDLNRELGLIEPDHGLSPPLNLNMYPLFPIRVLEEGSEYVTLVDEFGVTKRLLRADYDRTGGQMAMAGSTSSMAQWLDSPVKDLRSWETIREERFQPTLAGRLPESWELRERADFVRESQTRWVHYACFPLFGLFGPMREMMGLEGLAFAMADDPGFVHRVVDDLVGFWLGTFALVLRDGVRLDGVTFFEDMCATKAPIIGPKMFREFLAPGYRKAIGGLRELGVREFHIDTDGNAWDIIPEMIACGINGTSPCEAQAAMDVVKLRKEFPKFFLNGGIDKKAVAAGPAAMDRALARCFSVAWEAGRYVPNLDHGAPPDISWDNIRHFAKRCLEWTVAPPRKS